MQDRDGGIDSNATLIVVAFILVVIYGSLYPFHFRGSPDSNGPLRALINTWRGPFGRGDFLSNVLLYVPVGLFSVRALRRLPPVASIALGILGGWALSMGVELLQFYDEGRVSALADVYANTIGAVMGSVAGVILSRCEFSWRTGTMDRRPFLVLLFSCWLGYRLFPFVPVIDLHKYWTAIKPLIVSPTLSPLDLYRHIVIWLVVALLMEAVFGTARSRVLLPVLVLFVLFARIFIVDAVLSPAEVAGGAVAVLVWYLFLWQFQVRATVIASLFAAEVAIETLQPFQFSAVAHPFGWIPFSGLMKGSVEVNVRSFLEKAFTYGALTWLIARAGCRLIVAVGLSCGLVLCLRLSQMFLPGRSAEITDPIILLIVAGVMKSMGEDPTRFSKAHGNP